MICAGVFPIPAISSVYGWPAPALGRLPVVRGIDGTYQMLTAYCRITQTGTQDMSMTAGKAILLPSRLFDVWLTCVVGL